MLLAKRQTESMPPRPPTCQLEDQLSSTIHHLQDVIIPLRRVFAALASLTPTFSSLAYSVEAALQERDQDPRDLYDGFFRSQDALRDVLTHLHSFEVHPDSR